MADLMARVKVRLSSYDEVPSDDELSEIVATLTDRVCMRVGVADLPERAGSLVVDATVKAVNRRFDEGVTSESEGQTGSMSTTWVEDILGEYEAELAGLRDELASDAASTRQRVRFL